MLKLVAKLREGQSLVVKPAVLPGAKLVEVFGRLPENGLANAFVVWPLLIKKGWEMQHSLPRSQRVL